MAIIFFTSVSGAPGVTTTAVGLALAWPRPVILVEADTSKPSAVLPGYLHGQTDHARGLTPLTVIHQRGQLTPRTIWDQTVALQDDCYLIPGFSNLVAAGGTSTTFWNALGSAFTTIAAQGADVLIDAGRIGIQDARSSLMQIADLVTLVTGPTLPDIAVVAARRRDITAELEAVGHDDWLSLLVVDSPYEQFSNGEITKALRLPIVNRITHDPRTAAIYSVGADPTAKTAKSALKRDLSVLPNVLEQSIKDRREKLGVIPTEEIS